MIEQRAHFHLSELFSEDVMYKRDGDRTFANHSCHTLHVAFVSTFTIVGQINLRNIIVDREVAAGMLRLREQHGLPRLALCPDQALDTYWGNPSTTHTLLAD